MDVVIEVCTDDAAGCAAALEAGADRAELCADLASGGTTPSAGAIRAARERAPGLGLVVLCRPRGGDFLYGAAEFDVLRRDVEFAVEAGADAVAIGVLRRDGTVDRERTAELARRARPRAVCFHRAFDLTRDPDEALTALIELGLDRVLTSGGAASAAEGAGRLAALVERAAGRIDVCAAGGVRPGNVAELVARSGVREVHFSARELRASPMEHRATACRLAPGPVLGDYETSATNAERIRAVIAALR